MVSADYSENTVRFGAFTLDTRAGELLKHGVRLKLHGQPLQVLQILVEHAGDVVTRETLHQRLWPADTFVNFDHGLNNSVARIREALGDSPETPHYIQTLPRRGYRFIGTLESKPLAALHLSETAALPISSTSSRARRYRIGFVASVAVAGLIVAAWLVISGRAHRSTASSQIRSLLVLPFENLSGDPSQDYLADGLTDELITELAGLNSLRVISRTSAMSLRDTRKPLGTIARELDVDAVVEGSISRSGNRMRLRAQLIDARTDQHLWAQSYERNVTDVIEIESDVASQLAEQVSLHLAAPQQRLSPHDRPATAEAYEDYLRGWYFFDKRTGTAAQRSVNYFRKSLAEDPRFALGYVGLAEALQTISAMDVAPYSQTEPEALRDLHTALQLEPDLGEAHSALGLLEAQWNWNWAEAGKETQIGVERNPGSAITHNRHAIYLQAVGRVDDAVLEARRARDLDPLSFHINRELARALYLARRYDEASLQLDRTAEMQPHSPVVDNWRGWIAEKQGNYARAVKFTLDDITEGGADAKTVDTLRRAFNRTGWVGFCQAMLRSDIRGDPKLSAPYFIAVDEARLGNRDAAFAWLETALRTKSVWIIWIKVDPLLDDLRSDPRFPALVHKMGLP